MNFIRVELPYLPVFAMWCFPAQQCWWLKYFSTGMCKSRSQVSCLCVSAWSPIVHLFQPWWEDCCFYIYNFFFFLGKKITQLIYMYTRKLTFAFTFLYNSFIIISDYCIQNFSPFHKIIVALTMEMKMQKTVVVTKSVEYMPFLLSFILFINGAVWTVYAVLTKDLFIGVSFHIIILSIC